MSNKKAVCREFRHTTQHDKYRVVQDGEYVSDFDQFAKQLLEEGKDDE